MHLYQQHNLNPRERKRDDCVVRAIALATDKSWLQVFDGLVEMARKNFEMPSSKSVYETLLKQYGWTKHPMPKIGNRRVQLGNLEVTGRCVATVSGHMTVIIDGTVYDIWDCREKCVGNYWTRQT